MLVAMPTTGRAADDSFARWPSPIPDDCPFERSKDLGSIGLTGRHREYTGADYWYPTWAADGHLYSGCGDGNVQGRKIWNAGIVKIVGDDPLALDFRYLGDFNVGAGVRRYNSANLIKDGTWYYGLEDGWNTSSDVGVARFWGFLCSRDYDREVGRLTEITDKKLWRVKDNPYWKDPTGIQARHYPRSMPIGEYPRYDNDQWPPRFGGFFDEPPRVNRIRNPRFVDFGKNLEHSPDGYAYMTAHGSEGKKPPEWANGDSIYLLRAKPAEIIKPDGWEFFAGLDEKQNAVWVKKVAEAKPLLTWTDKLGSAAVTYNAGLKRYIMCVSPLVVTDNDTKKVKKLYSAKGCLLLEADRIAGPWRVFQFLEDFGPNAYTMSVPSKFISADGRTAWLLYSAGWGAGGLKPNPPGSKYAACFQEIVFTARGDAR
jgi:hypothetical protein